MSESSIPSEERNCIRMMEATRFVCKRLNSKYIPPVHSIQFRQLTKSQWCPEFERLMRNRLLMGNYRYAPIDNPDKGDYDLIASLLTRQRTYQRTGNLEHLVDMANMCLLEFMHSRHPRRHFKSNDDTLHTQKKGESA